MVEYKNKWIHVTERFPSQNGRYLTYHDYGWEVTSYNGRMLGFKRSFRTDPMTWYWMPLLPPQADNLNGWIPVSESLPPQNIGRVLVFGKGEMDILWYDHEGFYGKGGSNVTHWMPLPSPPEGGSQ